MSYTPASVAVLLLVVGAVAVAPAAGFVGHPMAASPAADAGAEAGAPDEPAQQTDDNRTDDAAIAPGAQLSGVVGVQKAEIEGDVERRSLDIAFDNADTNESKADVLSNQLGQLKQRLKALEERKQALNESLQNGSMTRDQYRAAIAEVAARTSTVNRMLNQTSAASTGLPADVLEAKGINATAIQRLKTDARNLSGPDVAAIARSIAGPGAGKGLAGGPPGLANRSGVPGGPPENAGPPNGSVGPGAGGPNASERPGPDRPNVTGGNDTEIPGGNTSDIPGDEPAGQNGTLPDAGDNSTGLDGNETDVGDEETIVDDGNGTTNETVGGGGNDAINSGNQTSVDTAGSGPATTLLN